MVVLSEKIVKEFPLRVRKKLKNRIEKIILFGSRARGDYKDYSDYDFLIIVDRKEKYMKDILLEVCVDILNEYDALINFILCDNNEWNRKKRFPVGLNIVKEGIEI